jgi:hypothetical protein
LAWWVYGVILAQSACQSAVVTALLACVHVVRQRLREWLYDGVDKAAPCRTQVEVSQCFAPLLRWVLSDWQGREIVLALDVTLHGRERGAVSALVRPGQAWVGRGRLGSPKHWRPTLTLVVVWTAEQEVPWAVVTDLPPTPVGVSGYALRLWVKLGFRALKGVGWQWQRTRRTERERVARYWLVLAVATLWVLAYGTRVEDALAVDPARLRVPPVPA